MDSVEHLLCSHLESGIKLSLAEELIKAPRAHVHANYFKDRFQNLSALSSCGYFTWYPELLFSVKKGSIPNIADIDPVGFYLDKYPWSEYDIRQFFHSFRELKTQDNHKLRFVRLTLPKSFFKSVIEKIGDSRTLHQPYIANLTAGSEALAECEEPSTYVSRHHGLRIVSFDHVVTGHRYFCQCHSKVHEHMLLQAKAIAPNYVEQAWPHRVISLLQDAVYVESICHFCIAEKYGEAALEEWYGDQVKSEYGAYVDLLVLGSNMDLRTAHAEAKRKLSIGRWIRQDELCRLVIRLFPEHQLQREASPEWLGQQRLDIYFPELGLAIEHQGEQHFHPIEGFGGKEAFLRNQERDKRKRLLCKENGVTVVDVRYDEPLTLPHLRARLKRWFPK